MSTTINNAIQYNGEYFDITINRTDLGLDQITRLKIALNILVGEAFRAQQHQTSNLECKYDGIFATLTGKDGRDLTDAIRILTTSFLEGLDNTEDNKFKEQFIKEYSDRNNEFSTAHKVMKYVDDLCNPNWRFYQSGAKQSNADHKYDRAFFRETESPSPIPCPNGLGEFLDSGNSSMPNEIYAHRPESLNFDLLRLCQIDPPPRPSPQGRDFVAQTAALQFGFVSPSQNSKFQADGGIEIGNDEMNQPERGRIENTNFEGIPTPTKTESSSCFGITFDDILPQIPEDRQSYFKSFQQEIINRDHEIQHALRAKTEIKAQVHRQNAEDSKAKIMQFFNKCIDTAESISTQNKEIGRNIAQKLFAIKLEAEVREAEHLANAAKMIADRENSKLVIAKAQDLLERAIGFHKLIQDIENNIRGWSTRLSDPGPLLKRMKEASLVASNAIIIADKNKTICLMEKFEKEMKGTTEVIQSIIESPLYQSILETHKDSEDPHESSDLMFMAEAQDTREFVFVEEYSTPTEISNCLSIQKEKIQVIFLACAKSLFLNQILEKNNRKQSLSELEKIFFREWESMVEKVTLINNEIILIEGKLSSFQANENQQHKGFRFPKLFKKKASRNKKNGTKSESDPIIFY